MTDTCMYLLKFKNNLNIDFSGHYRHVFSPICSCIFVGTTRSRIDEENRRDACIAACPFSYSYDWETLMVLYRWKLSDGLFNIDCMSHLFRKLAFLCAKKKDAYRL